MDFDTAGSSAAAVATSTASAFTTISAANETLDVGPEYDARTFHDGFFDFDPDYVSDISLRAKRRRYISTTTFECACTPTLSACNVIETRRPRSSRYARPPLRLHRGTVLITVVFSCFVLFFSLFFCSFFSCLFLFFVLLLFDFSCVR